jgi:DNA-binding NarL/FixJ family response regulator
MARFAMLADGVSLRVMVVDDHALVRAAIRQAISSPGIEVVAEAATAAAALETAPEVRPDVLLLDLGLPDRNGLQVLRELRERLPSTQVVVLTISGSPRDVHEAVRSGAAGYLTKDLDPAALFRAIDGIRHGQLAMSRTIATEAIRELRADCVRANHAPGDGLTLREEEVLRLMADGLTDRQIAARLGVSRRTAEAHVGHILHKLGARNRAQAVSRHVAG